METHRQPKRETDRLYMLTDGVFAIVATLLVLDIKLPDIADHRTHQELIQNLIKVIPSFTAFAFSFLTVIIYWINHDHIAQWLKHHDHPMKYLNLVFLFWLCLIPFPTKFISEYPTETVSVVTYGLEMFMVALAANTLFWYIAFRGKLLDSRISRAMRKDYLIRGLGGLALYFIAMLLSLWHVEIAIAFYIMIPLLYVILPKAELSEVG